MRLPLASPAFSCANAPARLTRRIEAAAGFVCIIRRPAEIRLEGATYRGGDPTLAGELNEAREGQGDNRRIVKELEKAKKRLATKLKQRADRERKDNAISFEELGIDQLFVDEADAYKNLFYTI